MDKWIGPLRRAKHDEWTMSRFTWVNLNMHFCVSLYIYIYTIIHTWDITHMICRYNKYGLSTNPSSAVYLQFLSAPNQILSFPFFSLVLSPRGGFFWSLSLLHPRESDFLFSTQLFPWVRAIWEIQRASWCSWCLILLPSLFVFLLSLHNLVSWVSPAPGTALWHF